MFWLRLQHLEVYGSASGTIWSIKHVKPFYYLYNSLAQQTISAEAELNFQAPAPTSESICPRIPPSEIVWASAPQP